MGSVCRAHHSARRVFALGNRGVLLRQLSEMCYVEWWRAVGDQLTGKVLPVSKLMGIPSELQHVILNGVMSTCGAQTSHLSLTNLHEMEIFFKGSSPETV